MKLNLIWKSIYSGHFQRSEKVRIIETPLYGNCTVQYSKQYLSQRCKLLYSSTSKLSHLVHKYNSMMDDCVVKITPCQFHGVSYIMHGCLSETRQNDRFVKTVTTIVTSLSDVSFGSSTIVINTMNPYSS